MLAWNNIRGAITSAISGTPKHDHYKDFGYPSHITFDMLHRAYTRNGLATAAVNETILKTWQTIPELWEDENPKESSVESSIRQHFSDLRFWQALSEADRRSLVGRYSGVIFRFADSKNFDEPVDTVPGGLRGLVGVIPAWEGQLQVSEWDTNPRSSTYGQPRMFMFNEASVDEKIMQPRSFHLHPDRVVVWSKDGTVNGQSALEPGFNSLIDIEKINGAGGEGYWKNAKSAPILNMDKEARIKDMADAMGVPVEEVADAMDRQVEGWNRGFDHSLLLQGIQATSPSVNLQSPEHFVKSVQQVFAASFGIPLRILVGSETGERASTEDQRKWSQVNMARRQNVVLPTIHQIVNRLERVGVLSARDWHVHWTDLMESSIGEKSDRAAQMTEMNAKAAEYGEPLFTVDEIRAVVEMDPMDEFLEE